MFNLPNTKHKSKIKLMQQGDSNNKQVSEHQQAREFIAWYKHMVDNERHNLVLYLSDDVTLEWFGRTVKTRKRVSAFIKYDMHCLRHDFITIANIDKIENRLERTQRNIDTVLATPLESTEIVSIKDETCTRKRSLRSHCESPEWAEGCGPQDEEDGIRTKKLKKYDLNEQHKHSGLECNEDVEINNKGDGVVCRRQSRKCMQVTPPNHEVGQGDCLPSTSGTVSTDSDKSHDTLNAQLLRLAVECNGYIELNRMRNSHSTDAMKWERKCKVQISYSEDPLNIGEYIIWALRYTDESKCRRNLLPAFEEAAKEEAIRKAL